MADKNTPENPTGNFSQIVDNYEAEPHNTPMQREDTNVLQLNEMDDNDLQYNAIPQDDQDSLASEPEDCIKNDGEDDEVNIDEDLREHEPDIEYSPDGILDEETVANGMSNLGRSADGTQQVYLHLTIPGFSLSNIDLLANYTQLQKVEIPYNEITDLRPLGAMPYLLELDASHNQLSTVLDFTPPHNLRVVDLSYNNITALPDLAAHQHLTKLVLDNNQISELSGVSGCEKLSHLSLAHNNIQSIHGLASLPIKHLNMSCNELQKIENIDQLHHLQTINLSGNKIRSLDGLQGHSFLRAIDLEDNEVIDLSEVQYIRSLSLLRELNLQRNPIRELPDYRLSILFYIQQLTDLDRRRVDVEEKVAATNMFNPPLEVMAARDHIMHVVYSFLQPSRVLDSTLPSIETPYPVLVLVGPQGAGKADLALKLVEEFSDYFGYGVTHTTRKPLPEEVAAKDHHFITIEEFEECIKMGRFLYTYSYNGDLYGLALEAVETVARDGLACVVAMELEGVLTLKNSHLEPRYVLLLPLDAAVHERRLRDAAAHSEPQIQHTLGRTEVYAEYNRQHPGFFDMMIPTDDVVEAYKQLRRLVLEYLGVSAPPTPSVSDAGTALERDATLDTLVTPGRTHSGLVRQWSKHSLPDSLSQALTNLKVRSAASPAPGTGRGIVEEQSLQRRQSAAKQTVTGHVPSIYEQLLQQAPRTVPQPVSAQTGLGESEEGVPRSYSAPTGQSLDALPPTSPDSSVGRSTAGSSLSDLSEAPHGQHDEPEDHPSPRATDLALPADALDRLDLLSGSGSKDLSGAGSVPLAPRPSSQASRPASQASQHDASRPTSRLGSERLLVLPPISQEAA